MFLRNSLDNENMSSTEFFFVSALLLSTPLRMDLAVLFAGCLLLGLIVWLLPLSALFNMSVQSCPLCGSKDVRRSKMAGVTDRMRTAIGFHPHRCRSCQGRFYRVGHGSMLSVAERK